MPKLVVIADDLTGANDTGVQFSKFGLQTIVLLDAEKDESLLDHADILVLDTDSRAVAPHIAEKRVAEACRIVDTLMIPHLYKKIDSTLRGNLGSEISAAAAVYKPTLIVIAPAFPKARRGTIGGHQLINGIPVSMTEIAHDPKTPVTESWIPELLQREDGKIGVVPLEKIMAGPAVIYEEITTHLKLGQDWLVFDATSEEQLRHITEAASRFEKVLWVGSAGLAEQLPVVFQWSKEEEPKELLLSKGKLKLVVAGSVSKITQKQIRTYIEDKFVPYIILDSVAAIVRPEEEINRVVSLGRRFLSEEDLVIYCSNEQELVAEVIAAGKSINMNSTDVGLQIANVLGQIVVQLGNEGLAGVFLTGGETAVSACRALGATGIEIVKEMVPGIPLGKIMGGLFQGLPVITKAGAFGNDQAIINAMKIFEIGEES